MGTTTFSGPVVSDNGFIGAPLGATPVNVTAATLAVTRADHAGRVVTLNKADGQTVTLPAATGTGASFKFYIGTTVTSVGTIIKVAASPGTDIMQGVAIVANDTDASASIFETGATADTITLNGTTTGGIKGDMVELIDVATGEYWVRVTASATSAEATPFSATVSAP